MLGAIAGPLGILFWGTMGAVTGGALGDTARAGAFDPLVDQVKAALPRNSSALILAAGTPTAEELIAAVESSGEVSRQQLTDEQVEQLSAAAVAGSEPRSSGSWRASSMIRGRLRRHKRGGNDRDRGDEPREETEFLEIEPGELTRAFAAPRWVRDLGFMSWLLVGVAAFLAGAVWLLALTQTIVLPVSLPRSSPPCSRPSSPGSSAGGCGAGSAPRSSSC